MATVAHALARSGLAVQDASVLLAHALGRSRTWLAAHADDPLPPEVHAAFTALAQRRAGGEPVAYLTGWREFFGLRLEVSPAVLIPRPETETLVEFALGRVPTAASARILDLGTGSGAIALALGHHRPRARIVASDVAPDALALARANARRLGVTNVEFVAADWFTGVAAEPFDVIVANPPYVGAGDSHLSAGDLRFEPRGALTPGDDALSALRCIVTAAPRHLAAGATLAVEHGYDQAEAVAALFAAAGFVDVVSVRDLAGIERVTAGARAG